MEQKSDIDPLRRCTVRTFKAVTHIEGETRFTSCGVARLAFCAGAREFSKRTMELARKGDLKGIMQLLYAAQKDDFYRENRGRTLSEDLTVGQKDTDT